MSKARKFPASQPPSGNESTDRRGEARGSDDRQDAGLFRDSPGHGVGLAIGKLNALGQPGRFGQGERERNPVRNCSQMRPKPLASWRF